jgi:MFS family permease
VQTLFKVLGGYQLVIFLIVAVLVFPPPEEEKTAEATKPLPAEMEITEAFLVNEEAEYEKKVALKKDRFVDEDSINFKYNTVWEALRSQNFILIFLSIWFSSGIVYMISINFKNYGITKIPDDEFITWVGSASTFINGVTRPLWGYLFDKYGFKKIFGSMLAVEIFICATFCYLAAFKVFFLLSSVAIFTIFGMHFVVFTPFITHIFGLDHIGSTILSLSFFSYSFSSSLQFLILNFLIEPIGLEGILWIEFVFGLICLYFLYKIKVPKRAL